jgi:hypothetical protein
VAKEMTYAVMVTSAINTKFGIYSQSQRVEQTRATIESIKQRIPDAAIVICEMSGQTLSDEQVSELTAMSDRLLNFTADSAVTDLYNSTDNWDVVKNVTEVMCFGRALSTLKETGFFDQHQRCFKISGRYLLDDRFDIKFYDEYSTQSMIVISNRRKSQFPITVTHVEAQYMSRLWSWPTTLTDEIIDFYQKSLNFMYERLSQGGYVDIEHCLYRFLDSEKLINRESLGIMGNIAPNGLAIKD